MKLKYKNNIIELPKDTETESIVIDENHFKINSNGSMINCYATEDENNIYVFIDGNSYHFDKVTEEEDFIDGGGGSNADRDEIKPPMPGSVVKVLVEVGQKVEAGEALIIVEAMKMETSLYASISGTVTEVNAEAGEQVDSTKTLILVEKAD